MFKRMKKATALLVIVALVATLFSMPVSAAEGEFVEISTAAGLSAIAENLNGKYKLTADIVLEDDFVSIGSTAKAGNFTGVLDGNGHSIVNLNLLPVSSGSSSVYCGLFAYINGGTVRNLKIEAVSAQIGDFGYLSLGAIAAKANKATISNCRVQGEFTVTTGSTYARIGGLVGEANTTEISTSVSDVDINYESDIYGANIGGIAGDFTGILNACENRGNITAKGIGTDSGACVGGIVAVVNSAKTIISNSINRGELTVNTKVDALTGGIVGDSGANTEVKNNISLAKIESSTSFHSGYNPDFASIGAGAIAGKSAGTSADNYYLSSAYSKAAGKGSVTATVKTVAELRTIAESNAYWMNASEEAEAPQLFDFGSHKFAEGVVTVQPTCLDNGVKTFTCSDADCDAVYTNPISAKGHSYLGKVTTDPTCTKKGVKTYTCSVCSNSYTEQIAALGHTEVSIPAVKATCEGTGLTEGKKCSVCNVITKEQTVVAALGHDIKVIEAVKPTCTEPGFKEGSYCTRCDEKTVGQELVPALGHSEKELAATPATCTTSGLTAGKICTVCGVETVKQNVIPELGHDWDDGEETTPATCSANGVKTFTCETCGDTKTEAIEKLGHNEGEPVIENKKAPDCVNAGSYDVVIYCAVCNAEISRKTEPVPAYGHSDGEPVKENEKAPDCVNAGSYDNVISCTVCGAETSRTTVTVDALGHKEVTLAAKAPTCTATGLTAGKQCSVCKEVTVKQNVVAAKGHTIVTIPAKAATYTATGLTAGKKCSVCGVVTVAQKVVAKLPQISLKKAKFTLKAKTYTGKALTQSFTVKLGSKTLKNKVDYTISYKNNKNIGKATVTIKGIGAYKDSVSKTFAINPKKLSGLKVKAGKKQLTVSWKKDSKVGGYEIVYATSKNFKSGKKTVKITKASTAKKVISKLKSKKTYYVKVRSFKKVSGKTYYGAYTSVKSVKVK